MPHRSKHAGAEALEPLNSRRTGTKAENIVETVHSSYLCILKTWLGPVYRRVTAFIKGKAVLAQHGIEICSDDVTIVADFCRKRGYRIRKLYVGECPAFPHKTVAPVPLFSREKGAHDHSLIIDAAGKCSACSAGKRDDGQLAIVQEEPEVRTIAVKLAGDVAEVIDACGNGRRIWKAWNIHAMKDAAVSRRAAAVAFYAFIHGLTWS